MSDLLDFEERARAVLLPHISAYYAAATGSGIVVAEGIARTGASWWFQVHVTRDHALTERLVERAVANGARALLLTVDMMAPLPLKHPPALLARKRSQVEARQLDARRAGRCRTSRSRRGSVDQLRHDRLVARPERASSSRCGGRSCSGCARIRRIRTSRATTSA
jgi:hypothetical protein